MAADVSSVPFAFSVQRPDGGPPLDPLPPTPIGEVVAMVAQARSAQQAWERVPVDERVEALRIVKDRLLDQGEALAALIHTEVGKPEVEALLGEVLPSADVVDHWCGAMAQLLAPEEVPLSALTYPGKRGATARVPRGVVAVIMPWNFPLALPLRTLVPALLAGNAVVFKPSEVTPRVGARIAALFEGVVPQGLVTLVQGGADAGGAVVTADVDAVAFTGSVPSGRRVALACAERLVPCSLELGGKDAAIVLADCDVERTAHGILWAAMMNAGQNCAAVERVYVEKVVAEAFVNRVSALAKELRRGDDVGPLTTEAQRRLVASHVRDAQGAGAQILVGGAEDTGAGYHFPPTVLRVDSDATPLLEDESFGPVLPIRVVGSAEEAVELANGSRYGLTASLWTADVARGQVLARSLRAGVVTLNNHAFTGALPGAPWSGYGDTGYGVTGSPHALELLTRPRFTLVDEHRGRELWWFPYTPALRTMAVALTILRSRTRGIVEKLAAVVRLVGALPKRFSP